MLNLGNNKICTSPNIRRNEITDIRAKYLAEALSSSQLQLLILAGNNISMTGKGILFKAAETKKIKLLI